MAELLIRAKEHWMVSADKSAWTQAQLDKASRQGGIGDIIQVFPDGKLSDYAHAGGKFYVLRIVGLKYEDALRYQEAWENDTIEKVDGVDKITPNLIKLNKYNIDLASLPTPIMNKLKKDFVCDILVKDIPALIYDKATTSAVSLVEG